MITFSENFVKTLTRHSFSKDSVLVELSKYSERNKFDSDETIFYFVLKLFSEDLFFKINEDEAKDVLYVAIAWSSHESFKSATRKTEARKVTASTREKNKYILLQTKVIESININFTGFQRSERLELYLFLFFELNCVKRKKKQAKSK